MKIERIVIYIMCFLFLFLGFLFYFGFKDTNQCLNNPFIYGVNKIETEDTGGISCTCYFGSPDYDPFYFDNSVIGTLSNDPIQTIFYESSS